ncbi:MAG: hypothetical protein NC912_02415 [Candidatus Omnitrophica bacterium]|nr:hypothetical protein [Candidatus Omnitrophota bacterium]
MRLKQSLRNLVNVVLAFSLFFLLFFISLSGCLNQIEPTYKEEDIPRLVKEICKNEYGLEVITQRLNNTLWVYVPLLKILHKDYEKQDKIFDEEILNKLRNILTTVGRIIISSDNAPEFFALLASDINLGLDYTIIGNVLDIKKSYAEYIPWTEANRRYVIRLELAPEAIGDLNGRHLELYDINLPDFLAEQIAQRISIWFQDEGMKRYFKVDRSKGLFINERFIFEYSIKQILPPPQPIDIKEKILDIITYCIKTYEFKDFSAVELIDLTTESKIILSNAAIWARPMP